MNSHLDVNPGRGGLSVGLGERELRTFGVKGGVILREECNLVREQD